MLKLNKGLFISLIFCLGFSCKPAQEAQTTIQDGAKTIVTQPERARVMSDLATVKPALQSYFAQHNNYPPSLQDLNLTLSHPEDLIYDPASGKVQSKSFPTL